MAKAAAIDASVRIFGFWTGDNPMNEARQRCWGSFGITGLEPTLVTPANLSEWVLPGHPLHPAYDYLSPVHRSDYLRPYFMYHYGGGYADIKEQTGSWLPAVDHLHRSMRLMGTGYREVRGGTVWLQDHVVGGRIYVHSWAVPRLAARFATDAMRALRPLIIGNGAFYFKPRTLYARLWLREVERRLDLLLPALKKNPARHVRDRLDSSSGEETGYPVPWAFLLGAINGPLALAFNWALSRRLPPPRFEGYL